VIQPAESSSSLERDIADVQSALARAAQHARERARQYGTAVVIAENGQVRHLDPNEESGRRSPPAPGKSTRAPGTSELESLKLSEFRQLRIEDRIRLAQEIWASVIAEGAAIPIPDWQKRELDEAVEEYLRDPAAGRPWEEIERDLRAGHRVEPAES
jgi:putative addiction module component (TIGR02574 family)